MRDNAGALAVRLNLFARKNTGSYYTLDALDELTLEETIQLLIAERLDALLGKLDAKDAEDCSRRSLRNPTNAILGN